MLKCFALVALLRSVVAGHRFLLHQQQSIQGRSEESLYTRCAKPLEDWVPKILQDYMGSCPNGMKLSSNTLLYEGFACLSAWSWSPQARWGQRVTVWDSIYFD
jgi:hypothetical protein